MDNRRKRFLPAVVAAVALSVVSETPAITIDRYGGWLESAYANWQPVNGAVSYEVSYSGNGVDECVADIPLVRQYPEGLRVDIPGLKAGDYTITIRAFDNNGGLLETATTPLLTVMPHLREGFAFDNGNVPGGYNLDGTPKDDARIIYVSANTVNTVTCEVLDSKGKATVYTGLGNILSAYGKGADKTPLIIRMIGTISSDEIEGLKDGNYINFQGRNNTTAMVENITLEGIGTDATLYRYGICFKRAHNIEIRNVGIMLFGDDAVSMDTDNSNIWLHNIDFFYGAPGSDADQVKGDGSIDMKYNSTSITISYNHFFDSGKSSLCGMKSESADCLREGADVTLVAYGTLINEAERAAGRLEAEAGISAQVIKLNQIAPLPVELVLAGVGRTGRLVVAEDCLAAGCVGEGLCAALEQRGIPAGVRLLNLGERFVQQGAVAQLRRSLGLDAQGIYETAVEVCHDK